MTRIATTVSPLTLGTSGLGRGTVPGSPEEAEVVADAVALLRSGHAYVDTSNNYSDGRSEAVIGLALREADAGTDAATHVITKVDVDPVTGAFDRDRVLRSFEESTARLGVDRLPLLHLHDPYAVSVSEAMGPNGAVEGLRELHDAGVVDAIASPPTRWTRCASTSPPASSTRCSATTASPCSTRARRRCSVRRRSGG